MGKHLERAGQDHGGSDIGTLAALSGEGAPDAALPFERTRRKNPGGKSGHGGSGLGTFLLRGGVRPALRFERRKSAARNPSAPVIYAGSRCAAPRGRFDYSGPA